MSSPKQHTVCIVGGGMSGLITGALLAKNGYNVTILEKNAIIGGGLQSFRRGDAVFNTGMQAFCGYDKGFALYQLFNYFGFPNDSIPIIPLDREAQEIVWTDINHCYHLPKTRQKYEEYLASQFPQQAQGIHDLLDDIYEIGSTFDYFWLHPMQRHEAAARYAVITARQLLEKHLTDERLRQLFEYVGMHLGYNLSVLPATELGMILNLYIEGGWRIAGGNIQLANLLASFIKAHDGCVLNNAEVSEVIAEEKKMVRVRTKAGQFFDADIFICAMPPKPFLSMTKGELFRAVTSERIAEFNNDSSCYICHAKLKPNRMKYHNNLIFIPVPENDKSLPHYISMLTPPSITQDEWAQTVEILCFVRYHEFKQWENTVTGRRGEEYEQQKSLLAQQTVNYISQFYPELKDAIEQVYVSTPLTIRDYYSNPDGAVYAQQGLFAPVKAKATNLFLTGQSVQYQGLFGVATTAIATVETILGKSLIEEIANA